MGASRMPSVPSMQWMIHVVGYKLGRPADPKPPKAFGRTLFRPRRDDVLIVSLWSGGQRSLIRMDLKVTNNNI
jgi:hypothetical protein